MQLRHTSRSITIWKGVIKSLLYYKIHVHLFQHFVILSLYKGIYTSFRNFCRLFSRSFVPFGIYRRSKQNSNKGGKFCPNVTLHSCLENLYHKDFTFYHFLSPGKNNQPLYDFFWWSNTIACYFSNASVQNLRW